MKGFAYLIEIVLSTVLIIVVFGTFFTVQNIRQSFERSDLIGISDSIFESINSGGNISKLLNNDFSEIDNSRPKNVGYGISISGTAKNNITVGCLQNQCSYISSVLTPAFLNKYQINFAIVPFDIDASPLIPNFDVVVLVNYTNYTFNKVKLMEFSQRGILVGINATYSADPDFFQIFNLTTGSGSTELLKFRTYSPATDKLEKYFFGIGIDIPLTTKTSSQSNGTLTLWGDVWDVKVLTSDTNNAIFQKRGSTISVTKTYCTTYDYLCQSQSIFTATGPDGLNYSFKIKRISLDTVDMNPMNFTFPFVDFSERNAIGVDNSPLRNSINTYAALTTNKNSIWISDFPPGDEYKSAVKAAITSRITLQNWYLKQVDTTQETVSNSYFFPLCCDITDVIQLNMIMWYRF